MVLSGVDGRDKARQFGSGVVRIVWDQRGSEWCGRAVMERWRLERKGGVVCG